LWNFLTAEELASIAGHRDKIGCVAFSLDDRFFASGSDDGTILIWEAATGRHVRRLEGHRGPVLSLDYREYADLLVSGGKDKTIRVWNLKSNSCQVFKGHTGAVNSVAFGPNQYDTPSFVVSGSGMLAKTARWLNFLGRMLAPCKSSWLQPRF
jgi:WD40 repeat protein